MDKGYTSQQFISLFNACNAAADRQVEQLFTAEFGHRCHVAVGVSAAAAAY